MSEKDWMTVIERKRAEIQGFAPKRRKERERTAVGDAIHKMSRRLGVLFFENRVQLGLTQVEAAKRIKTSQARVAKLESGRASVSLDASIRGLLALGVSPQRIGKALGG